MKHKVSELEGALLDRALSMAAHMSIAQGGSSDWSVCGPLIEREQIDVMHAGPGRWAAGWALEEWKVDAGIGIFGPTPQVAVVRAFVTSKFGEEVELP